MTRPGETDRKSAWGYDEYPTVYLDNLQSRCSTCNRETSLLVFALTTVGIVSLCGLCVDDARAAYVTMMSERMQFDMRPPKASP